MKFALSMLSTAVMTTMMLGLATPAIAQTEDTELTQQNDVMPITVTQIVDANDPSNTQNDNTAITNNEPHPAGKPTGLTTLIDPITHKSVDNSYPDRSV